ncbi:MAG: FAD-dependent oxidoreductase, partial [Bacteroidales bacterium]
NHAVLIGAGFIGLEMAENLQHLGAQISIIEMGKQVMAPVDFSIASLVHQHLLQKGVKLFLEKSVEKLETKSRGLEVFFTGGGSIEADLVILAIGVRPQTALAKSANLKIGDTGGIWVNEYLETSVKDIYAVGDAIEFPHPLSHKPWLNYLANPANRQGRIVADNMVFGNTISYEGAIGTSIAKVMDITVATTGLPAKKLQQMGIKYASSTTHSSSHALYYPGALALTIKLTFDPVSGKLYGAQSVGYDGVSKRIDQIALLIKQGGSIYDLIKVEHSYAPPFSSAKDPIAIAGYVASNIINATMPIVNWREMSEASPKEILFLDVRTEEEYNLGSIPGSIHIPLDDLRSRLSEIPTNKPIYIYCAVGLRGYLALKILAAHGYTKLKNLSGGYKTYLAATTPINNDTNTPSPTEIKTMKNEKEILKIDACGLACPGPIIKIKQAINSIAQGDQIEILATDPGFSRDAQAWCNTTGNCLLSKKEDKGYYSVIIEKGETKACKMVSSCDGKAKTFIMFSDDLDKALATFVLANGAAATNHKVTIFFTFWGLNVIKKSSKPKTSKDIFGKMFGM